MMEKEGGEPMERDEGSEESPKMLNFLAVAGE
jgi:hypothetical protein